jgi:ankyrin repeat protein
MFLRAVLETCKSAGRTRLTLNKPLIWLGFATRQVTSGLRAIRILYLCLDKLMRAAAVGDVEVVRHLLQAGAAHTETVDADGWSALMVAAF